MQGPFDPQHPGQDAGAPQPEAQDGDLHALLERLLGQGDVPPSAPGAGGDLWPDLFVAPQADEVSTIVTAPDAPTADAESPDAGEPVAPIVEPAAARPWEPVVVDRAAISTNVDDIHAAILASVSVELQPIAPAVTSVEERAAVTSAAELAAATVEPAGEPDATEAATSEPELAPPADVAPIDIVAASLPGGTFASEDVAAEPVVETAAPGGPDAPEAQVGPQGLEGYDAGDFDLHVVDVDVDADEPGDGFVLTPFEGSVLDGADDLHPDAEALWAAAVPELGLEVAPLLDLDPVEVDPADVDSAGERGPVTAVVLPWPSHELTPREPAAPAAHDLIEAALSGLHADLTAEPIEPLRTPDVAVSTAHVVFHLGGRTMAIPLAAVSEIARPPKVTRLPHVPAWVLGIANLRGDIVSMVDLEGFFSGKAGKSTHEQRMLALRPSGDEVTTAVLVDSVDGIQAFEDARVARVTRGYDAEVAPYARGLYQVEDDLVVVLDADRLLQSKPMRQFEDGAGAR